MPRATRRRRSQRGGIEIDTIEKNFSNEELEDHDLQAMINNHELDEVRVLHLHENHLTHIDALPDTIRYLNVDSNHIQTIEHLPADLRYFNSSYNPLMHIAAFPPNLKQLSIADAELQELPELPDSLQYLALIDSGLPENYEIELPVGLRELQISSLFPLRIRGNAGPITLQRLVIQDQILMMNADIPAQYQEILRIVEHPPFQFNNNNANANNNNNFGINPANPANLAPNFNTSNIQRSVPFYEPDPSNVFMSEMKANNLVARISGNDKTTHPGNYALIQTADPERTNTANTQRRYLRTRGNPLTRAPINVAAADIRRVRSPTQREQLMYNVVKKSEDMSKKRAAAAAPGAASARRRRASRRASRRIHRH